MKLADRIRKFGREKYIAPAVRQKQKRFSIRTGDVVRQLGIGGSRAPAVCSALKTRDFLQSNNLRLVQISGPKSGQSTTVIYTYEFGETDPSSPQRQDPWIRLRGALKNVFSELGGGEAYLRAERENFFPPKESQ